MAILLSTLSREVTIREACILHILIGVNLDYIGRIAKSGTVLGAFDIKYMPRTAVKGLVLVDLVAEFAEPPLEEVIATQNMDRKSVGTISLLEPLFWKVYVDGAVNQRGSRVGLVLVSPEQITIQNVTKTRLLGYK